MAHLQFRLHRLSDYSDDALFSELRRVASLVSPKPLTRKAFDEHARVSASTVMRRFGGWQLALESAGLASMYGGQPVTARMREQPGKGMSREAVLAEIKSVSERLGRNGITVADFNSHASVSVGAVRAHFKFWRQALEAAELTARPTSARYSDEECFENLLQVWTALGRPPKYLEMGAPPSRVGGKAYVIRWGSWVKALEAFVGRVEQDSVADAVETPEEVPIVVPRTAEADDGRIRLGIRYRVLVRDSFKCCLCGSSPATDQSCRLHIDHIHPHSRGGLTVIENLRTLCSSCNVGKGALVIENAG